MGSCERSVERAPGGEFVPRSQLLSVDDVQRVLRRIAHEIDERNPVSSDLVLIGVNEGGVAMSRYIADQLMAITGSRCSTGIIDVTPYRDDLDAIVHVDARNLGSATDIPVSLEGKTVVIVDDVLFTGRTIRACLNALGRFGRTRRIQLAVLVDRGHRELPIRPDFVGKNIPTRRGEHVEADMSQGVWIGDRR